MGKFGYITKDEILTEIKKHVSEMPMKFDGDARPDPSVEDELANKKTPLSKNPALDIPVDPDDLPDDFAELLASKRYQQVVEKLKDATGIERVASGQQGMMQLMPLIGQSFMSISQIEDSHRDELQKLAVELVVAEEGLTQIEPGVFAVKSHPEKAFKIQAKLVGMGQIDTDDFQMTPEEEPEEETFELEQEAFETFEDLSLERAKRRFINSIIQGSSKRGHYMYAMVQDRLRDITGSDQLFNQYGVMMAANDMMYWQLPASMFTPQGGQTPIGGREEIDMEGEDGDETPIIRATAVAFPILVHEIIKGIKEFLGAFSMDDMDVVQAQKVMELEDTLDKEVWDLRLGPAIWDRFRASYPEDVLVDEDKRYLQNALYSEFVLLDARELLTLSREVIMGTNRGKKAIQDLVDGILERMKGQEAEEAMAEFRQEIEGIDDDTDDDDLSDFLGSLGIDLS